MVETLEDIKRQLRKETAYEDNKREMAAHGRERADLKGQIKAKQFARKNPKLNAFFGGVRSAAVAGATGIQKAAAETQRREKANKSKKKGKKKPQGTFNLYGERIY